VRNTSVAALQTHWQKSRNVEGCGWAVAHLHRPNRRKLFWLPSGGESPSPERFRLGLSIREDGRALESEGRQPAKAGNLKPGSGKQYPSCRTGGAEAIGLHSAEGMQTKPHWCHIN
jgi:hypothetical protein